jgi:cellulose synthase operon protein YhjQ
MTDRGPLYDQNETPEDVATLYSWANLHGAKYRDFSASRAQTREKARLRVQQAIEEEQARAQQLAGAEHPVEIQNLADVERAAEMRRLAEQARAAEVARNEELAAQQAAREAADKAAREAGEAAARQAAEQKAREAVAEAARQAAEQAEHQAAQEAAQRAAEQAARQAAEAAAHQAAAEAAQRAAEQAARQAAEAAAHQAAQEAAQRAAEQAARQAAEQAAQEMARRAAQLAAQQAAEKAAQLAAEKAAEQAARAAAEKAAQQLAEQKLAEQRAAQEAQLQATRLAAEKAAQQLAAQRAALQAQAAKDAAQRVAEEAARQAEQQAARQAAERAAQQRAAQLAAEAAAQEAAERFAQEAAQRAAHEAAEQAAQQAAEAAAQAAAQQAAQLAAHEAAQREAEQQAQADRLSAALAAEAAQAPSQPAAPYYSPKRDYPGYIPPQTHAPAQSHPHASSMHEDSYPLPRNPWATADPLEHAGRPAWLMPERAEVAPQQAVPQAPEDTLQGSRDRLASRWYALRGVFEGAGAPAEAVPAPVAARAPVVAIFSLAGGVGKTSLVATLGRALSARGERVLLVDTAPYGLLPFFFGARDQRPGLLRTFSPPGNSGDAPIQMVTIDPEGLGPDTTSQDALSGEITTYSRGASRVIVDLATASGATTRRVLRLAPLVLVPLVPDMNSVVSFSSIDSFFQHNGNAQAKPPLPFYVLNQFDPSLPLHLDIREVLREQLGDRLLPFVLRRAPAVSEALAEGMTVMDYAPNSTVAEDFGSLAGWVKSQSAAASSTYRGVRWSER